MLKRSIGKNAAILALFALATAGTLAITQITTKEPIERAIREASAKALLEIIPIERHSNDMLVDTYPIPKQYWAMLGLKEGGDINLARETDGTIDLAEGPHRGNSIPLALEPCNDIGHLLAHGGGAGGLTMGARQHR